jgi:phosphoglycerate dehydrogenase-like enzyme
MTKPVIVIVEPIYLKAPAVFDEIDFASLRIVAPEEEAVAEAVRDAGAAAVVLGVDPYRDALYRAMPSGGLLARFGVGYDGVDLEKARDNNLLVTNTPGVLETTVAESTVFLAAEVLRAVGEADHALKAGRWSPTLGEDLGGKTWCIVGFGRIGSALARMLSHGFGVRVYGVKTDLSGVDALRERSGASRITDRLEEVVLAADIVSLHLPATAATRHFMDAGRLRLLKPGAVLINTGRGSLVDTEALYDALVSGKLGAAALDVFEREPYEPANPDKDLRTLSNVILTPHISSSTRQCAARIARRVTDNIRFMLRGDHARMDLVGR